MGCGGILTRASASEDFVRNTLFRTHRVGGAIAGSEELSRFRQRNGWRDCLLAQGRTGGGGSQLRHRSGQAGGVAEPGRRKSARGAGGARVCGATGDRESFSGRDSADDTVDDFHAALAAGTGEIARSGFEPADAARGAQSVGGIEKGNLITRG